MQQHLSVVPKCPKFVMKMHLNFDSGGQAMYRDDEMGVQMEVHTPKNKRSGKWGVGKTYYFIDGDKREFKTVVDLMKAWEELNATKEK